MSATFIYLALPTHYLPDSIHFQKKTSVLKHSCCSSFVFACVSVCVCVRNSNVHVLFAGPLLYRSGIQEINTTFKEPLLFFTEAFRLRKSSRSDDHLLFVAMQL